ncbi:MAG TPA: hypothetical protein VFA22_08890 [Stellaceae bacterium]|nr:hypothetical protein [Stellaceae bacterium]
MTGRTSLGVLACAATMLWGCSGSGPASSPWYQSPPGLDAAHGAVVSKSDNQAGGTIPDGDTRVVTVDGQTVSPAEWDKVTLPPGPHTLGVQYNGTTAAAKVEIRATLRAGAAYEVKGERTGPCDANLWLEDHGTPAAPKLETHLTAKPSQYGSSVMAVACN